jgi:hypothetical protein
MVRAHFIYFPFSLFGNISIRHGVSESFLGGRNSLCCDDLYELWSFFEQLIHRSKGTGIMNKPGT